MKKKFMNRPRIITVLVMCMLIGLSLIIFPGATHADSSSTTVNLTSGSTWTVPSGVYSITVEAWGGGGGTARPETNSGKIGGGGGGAYSSSSFAVTPNQTISYRVGSGGSNQGGNGGETWFMNSNTLLAKGGSGASTTSGASGGQASQGVGDTKGDGNNGSSVTDNNGGNGGDGYGASGTGGAGGAQGNAGVNGGVPGGGGGGASRSGNSSNGYAGSRGGSGLIKITYQQAVAPSITGHPNNQIVTYGESVSFTASASGTPTPDVQWQVRSGGIWKEVDGANSSTLTFSPTVEDSGNRYRAVFSNIEGTVTTSSATLTVNKADVAVTLDNLVHTYDGNPKEATATAGGANVTITYSPGNTAPTEAGSYTVVGTVNDPNYVTRTATGTLRIRKADATFNIQGADVVYDGEFHGAGGTATGANGADLSGLLTFGAKYKNAPGGLSEWRFAGDDNHKSASGQVQIKISKADANISVEGKTVTYDGQPHGASGSATGVKGENLSDMLSFGESFTDAPGGKAEWSFSGTQNYNSASGSVDININKAEANISVKGRTVTYNGRPYGATGTATGVDGKNLSDKLDLGASFTDVPGGIATWSFEGDDNHNPASGKAIIVIKQAKATINVEGANATYDGDKHGATGTAISANGVDDLSEKLFLGIKYKDAPGGWAIWAFMGDRNHKPATGVVFNKINKANAVIDVQGTNVTYDGKAHGATGTAIGADGSDLKILLNLGQKFTNVPGGTAEWSFSGDRNHNPASGTAKIVITKANATFDIKGANVTYDGELHGASGTATSANGVEDLSELINFGTKYRNFPGGLSRWTFSGDDNHRSASGWVFNRIDKAKATINVTGANAVYDGTPHGATGTAFGADGNDMSRLLSFGQKHTNYPGGWSRWLFLGNLNHYPDSGLVYNTIQKATADVILDDLSHTYDGSAKIATATTIPAGLNVTFTYDGADTAPINAGSYEVIATVDENNYKGQATGTLVIEKADAIIDVQGVNVTYDGNAHGASGSAIGADGEDMTALLSLGESFTDVPGGAAIWSFEGDDNHNEASGSVDIVINKATANVTLGSLNQTYDGSPKAVTSTTTPGGLTVQYTYNGIAAAPSNAGTYPVIGTINDINYEGTATANLIINKAATAITLGNLSQTYNGSPIAATASTNPGGLNVVLTYNGSQTVPTNAGTYTVAGTVVDANYAGSVTGSLVINKATAEVTLGRLRRAYDGGQKVPTAATDPNGLNIAFTYNGSTVAPRNIGTYTVVGTIIDDNYEGTITGELVIAEIPTYTLTVSILGQGTVALSSDTYEVGEVISLAGITATPAAGYEFVGWQDANGNPISVVTMDGDTEIMAVFREIAQIAPEAVPEAAVGSTDAGDDTDEKAAVDTISNELVPEASATLAWMWWLLLLIPVGLLLWWLVAARRRKEEAEEN